MADCKRPLFIGIGWGIGTCAALAIVVGFFLWYNARPKAPKPWNPSAIIATYDYVYTEGDNDTIVFYYTLENTTDFDYRIEDGHDITMSAKLESQNSLSNFTDERIDFPIYVPSKKRVRFAVHIGYPYPVKENMNADKDERKKYREGVEKYVLDQLGNLNGFELLDTSNRYDIVFEGGWKKPHSPDEKPKKRLHQK